MAKDACPVCGSQDYDVFIPQAYDRQFNVSQKKFDYVMCLACQSVFITPFPSLEEIIDFYPHSDRYYAYDIKSVPNSYRLVKKYAQDHSALTRMQLKVFFPYINFDQPGRVLDFGCGVGHFLDGMKQLGWDTWGIEIDEKSAALAARNHQIVSDVSQLHGRLPEGSFDLITSFQSIEHLPQPVNVFSELRKYQKSSGVLVVETPNTDCGLARNEKINWRGLECPRHLCLFNPASMRYLLAQAGYSKVQVKTRNAPSDLVDTMALAGRSFLAGLPRKIKFSLLIPWVLASLWFDRGKGALLKASAQI